MRAAHILDQVAAAGVHLVIRDGQLIASPKAAVTPDVLQLLRAHKIEILAAMQPANDPGSGKGVSGLEKSGEGENPDALDPLLQRALDGLVQRPDRVRTMFSRDLNNGRSLVAVAVRLPTGTIEALLLDAAIDGFDLADLWNRHNGETLH